ncbi:hypothetical protein MARINON1_52038 [Marinobacter salarius]|nr:hypothetical protein MBHK15_110705 [Marinobacter salarius]VXC07689.1 hypothetical protein MARINON1_52038 [Marinobacter salarius]
MPTQKNLVESWVLIVNYNDADKSNLIIGFPENIHRFRLIEGPVQFHHPQS